MPYDITKVKGGYQVKGPGGVHAKRTTKAKADAQVRLLHGVDAGWKPTGQPSKNRWSDAVSGPSQAVMGAAKRKARKR